MGLFRKKSPAEKKLNDLVGGFLLSVEFMDILKRWGLKNEDGLKIKDTVKEEIKTMNLSPDDVSRRIHYHLRDFAGLDCDVSSANGDYARIESCPTCGKDYAADLSFCPYCFPEENKSNVIRLKNPNSNSSFGSKNTSNTKKCPKCGQVQEKENSFCIDCGYGFSKSKTCPVCNQSQEESNRFCIDCGYDFVKKAKKPSSEMRKFKFLANQEHNLMECPDCGKKLLKNSKYCPECGNDITEISKGSAEEVDDVSELEALYNKTVSEKYSPNFKFAYVIFLDSYGRGFPKVVESEYKITENDLNTQAIKDEFVCEASPLISAQKFKVSDLKEILRNHGLKVSGKKNELIERLGDNLSIDELQEIFPEKSYELSDKGREFVDENDYILFYEDNYNLKKSFTPNEFEMIFRDRDYSTKEEMSRLIIEKIESKQNIEIHDVESLIMLYTTVNNQLKLLDNYFKLFIYSINSNMQYSNPDEMNSLYSLLHSLSLDINDLKKRFHDAYSNFSLIELKINEQDAFTFLLKLFSGVSIYEMGEEINQRFFAFD